MSLDLALVLLMLAAAISMFVLGRPRMDAVALLVLAAMPFTGIVTMNEVLAGFSDPTIILIAALFVIGEGLVRTGVARRLGAEKQREIELFGHVADMWVTTRSAWTAPRS